MKTEKPNGMDLLAKKYMQVDNWVRLKIPEVILNAKDLPAKERFAYIESELELIMEVRDNFVKSGGQTILPRAGYAWLKQKPTKCGASGESGLMREMFASPVEIDPVINIGGVRMLQSTYEKYKAGLIVIEIHEPVRKEVIRVN